MRQERVTAADANPDTLITIGQSLVAVHDWTFLLGPSFVLGVSTVLMAYLMYRSGLVPRFVGVLGLVGGPLPCPNSALGSAMGVVTNLRKAIRLHIDGLWRTSSQFPSRRRVFVSWKRLRNPSATFSRCLGTRHAIRSSS
jgi:hypothetical protein